MSQTQHTPGPWTVAGDSQNDGEAEVIESPTRTVAWTTDTCTEPGWGETTAEDRANGRLIAAAPDLLAALKGMIAATSHDIFTDAPECAETVEAVSDAAFIALAAIAKAEGRAA